MLARNVFKFGLVFGLAWSTLTGSATAQEKPSGPQRWEAAIAAFEAKDKSNPPKPGSVLFLGSSSIRMWKTDNACADLPAINRGFGGSQIEDSLHFIDRLVYAYEPRAIVFYAGDNDIGSGKSPERVAGDFEKFCNAVHKELPKCQVLFVAIKPSIRRWNLVEKIRDANERIASYCKDQPQVTYVDIFTPMLNDEGTPRPELFVKDGLHMSQAGYDVWEKALQPLLYPAK